MEAKTYLEVDVLEAARQRLRETFDSFPNVYASFSGGKDSGVMLNLAIEIAREKGRLPLAVLCIDLEAQYAHTIGYVKATLSRPEVTPFWVCLPLHLRNAVSQFQPHWVCWDSEAQPAWVRQMPEGVIADTGYFPFFRKGMEFEEFTPAFGEWFAKGEPVACLVGIRSDESLNRFRTIKNMVKETKDGKQWTTRISSNVWNVYPIYDWRTEDVWTANGKFGWEYNSIYDLMHLAGIPLSEMRLCQPYGDDQRKGLYLFKILEPETWSKVVARVEGANFGNRYSQTQKHVLGNFKVDLPPNHTYESYAQFLLGTMPPHISEHYRAKITTFLKWWLKKGVVLIPDEADPKLEASKKAPSWRRIVKVLLKNDYWCKGLSFTQTKREMEKQLALMASLGGGP